MCSIAHCLFQTLMEQQRSASVRWDSLGDSVPIAMAVVRFIAQTAAHVRKLVTAMCASMFRTPVFYVLFYLQTSLFKGLFSTDVGRWTSFANFSQNFYQTQSKIIE